MRSIEQGSAKWFAIVGVFIGLGFLTKALQVLLVVPAFGLAYLLFADTTLRRASPVPCSAPPPWSSVPAGGSPSSSWSRPACAPTSVAARTTRSFRTFGYNGLGRINRNETGSVGGGTAGARPA